MDIPGFKLSAYRFVHMDLRPLIDHDLVGDLMSLIEEGGRGAQKKALAHLRVHLEEARLLRDLELPGNARAAIRLWEALNVDEDDEVTALAKTNAPACFGLDLTSLDRAVTSYGGTVCQ